MTILKNEEKLYDSTLPHLEEFVWNARETGIVVRMWVFQCEEKSQQLYHVGTDARDTVAGRNVVLYEGLVDFNADLPGMHYSSLKLATKTANDGIETLNNDTSGKFVHLTDDELVKSLYDMFAYIDQENNRKSQTGFEDALLDLLGALGKEEAPAWNALRDNIVANSRLH